jgi:hypothetical protein
VALLEDPPVILRAYFATLGKIALLLACMAFLTGLGLLVIGGFLSTWPIHRQGPRSAKLQQAVGGLEIIIPAVMRAVQKVAAEKAAA